MSMVHILSIWPGLRLLSISLRPISTDRKPMSLLSGQPSVRPTMPLELKLSSHWMKTSTYSLATWLKASSKAICAWKRESQKRPKRLTWALRARSLAWSRRQSLTFWETKLRQSLTSTRSSEGDSRRASLHWRRWPTAWSLQFTPQASSEFGLLRLKNALQNTISWVRMEDRNLKRLPSSVIR